MTGVIRTQTNARIISTDFERISRTNRDNATRTQIIKRVNRYEVGRISQITGEGAVV